MILETNRLKIISLSKSLMELYYQDNDLLEKALNLLPKNRQTNEHVKNVVKNKILPVLDENESNNLFSTFWTIIDKENNCMVGDLCFKGNPNEKGEIEIGYGTHQQFQGKKYMTEAVGCVTNWAITQPNVAVVTAQTNLDNIASQKILSNTNFINYETDEVYMKWKFEKK